MDVDQESIGGNMGLGSFEGLVNEIDRVLAEISPRAAAVTILLFERVVARYEREKGRQLTDAEREAILGILRYIVNRDSRTS